MDVYKSSHTAEELETAIRRVDNAFDAGVQSEYDRFWDAYQDNGNRTYYNCGFAREGWTDISFKPKYNIICGDSASAVQLFWSCMITDLAKIIEETGIILDTSAADLVNTMFGGSVYLTRLPEISIISATNADAICVSCYSLVEFKKLICNENTTFNNAFTDCRSLTTIEFGGCIGRDINFQWSPLSVYSMKSIITHLKDYSSDSNNAFKYTLTFNADCWSALEADSTSPNGNRWRDYVNDLGWNAV